MSSSGGMRENYKADHTPVPSCLTHSRQYYHRTSQLYTLPVTSQHHRTTPLVTWLTLPQPDPALVAL